VNPRLEFSFYVWQNRLTHSFTPPYLRKISNWNDAAITNLNPGLTLPDKKIIPAHRAEDSGTKYILFDYLAKASRDWKLTADATGSIG